MSGGLGRSGRCCVGRAWIALRSAAAAAPSLGMSVAMTMMTPLAMTLMTPLALWMAVPAAQAAEPAAAVPSLLAPPVAADGSVPAPGWRSALLPSQTLPATRFLAAPAAAASPAPGPEGRALRIEADGSYGNLLHAFDGEALRAQVSRSTLAWWWRIERANPAIDLATRSGDDTDLKVCVLFDLPLQRVPLGERLLLQIARQRTGEALPAATLCYVADVRQATAARLDNAYSRRVRYVVLRGAGDDLSAWKAESRRLADDFRLSFGDESSTVPPVLAIAVGADADNTRGSSRALLAGLRLLGEAPARP